METNETKLLKGYLKRVLSAIEETKKYQPNWIRENLKANLNPMFKYRNDGRVELVFGIDSSYEVQLNFQNSGKFNKRDIINALQELYDTKYKELKELRRKSS